MPRGAAWPLRLSSSYTAPRGRGVSGESARARDARLPGRCRRIPTPPALLGVWRPGSRDGSRPRRLIDQLVTRSTGRRSGTRACSYDRAGFGWSDAGPMPRTAGRIADELRMPSIAPASRRHSSWSDTPSVASSCASRGETLCRSRGPGARRSRSPRRLGHSGA